MGVHRRDLVPEVATLHGRLRSCLDGRCGCRHERADALHGRREPLELGAEDGVVLHGLGAAVCGGDVVLDARDQRVCSS